MSGGMKWDTEAEDVESRVQVGNEIQNRWGWALGLVCVDWKSQCMAGLDSQMMCVVCRQLSAPQEGKPGRWIQNPTEE